MNTDPARHGHQCLKKGKHARNAAHPPRSHLRLIQPIGKGYGKGIHRKPYPQQHTVKQKHEANGQNKLLPSSVP